MNLLKLFKKFTAPTLAFLALNSGAMQPYFGALHNGTQMPLNLPLNKPKTVNVNWNWPKQCQTLQKEQLLFELQQFFKVESTGLLSNAQNWITNTSPVEQFENPDLFTPFVAKLEVKPGAEIAFHGDIHGDKDSLIAYLEWLAQKGYTDQQDPFTIKKDNFYIVFLGDYTDRGKYGPEVICTIARLKRTNPDKVFLVRGNHEDVDINARYGFKKQLEEKFSDTGNILRTVKQMYNYLPVALYIVCDNGTTTKDTILCCHGGVEVGFNATTCQNLLNSNGTVKYTPLGTLLRQTNCCGLPLSLSYIKNFPDAKDFIPTSAQQVHFMWNDFDVSNLITSTIFGRAWECDKPFTDFVNTIQSGPQCKIRGIFRGHQHSDNKMMLRIFNRDKRNHDADIGVGKLWIETQERPAPGSLWDGIVCTFSVCPHTGYGEEYKFNFDSFGILKTAKKYTDWKLQMHRITPSLTQ